MKPPKHTITSDQELDLLLDSITIETGTTTLPEEYTTTQDNDKIEVIQLAEGETDPRLKLISHSARTTLHTCPRKYQLNRLKSLAIYLDDEKKEEGLVTFAFGKAVGVGVQSSLEGKSNDQCIMDTFLEWDTDLLAETPRQNKSVWSAIFAVQKFISLRAAGFLEDYELVEYKGKPAIELSFQVLLPNGFRYRGFVDAILRHKLTGEIMVLENKTSSYKTNSATYKNSGQALGYSVVLDIIFPTLSSYKVLYMVYETNNFQYVELPFNKSLLQRALWLQELLIDTQIIEMYESYHTYPMHGESCYSYFRDCEYLSLCTMSTDRFTKPLTQKILDDIEEEKKSYDFTVSFEELIEAQVAKGEL